MNEQQTAILVMLLTVLVQSGLLTTLAVLGRKALLDRMGPQRAALAMQFAYQAVRAVEQIANQAGWTNPEKLREAAARARTIANQHGITLSDLQWNTLIEAAVHEMQSMREVVDDTLQ